MRKINLRVEGNNSSLEVFKLVAGSSPNKAMNLEEMRHRIRVLDAIEAVNDPKDALYLEEADWNILAEALKSFPWAVASRTLVAIIDDVLEATVEGRPHLREVEK